MSHLPIADYGLISDCRSAALVSRQGSIDWLCIPRFDAPSIFGRLLDRDAGHWSIGPAEEGARIERAYEDATMVLSTTFRTSSGVLRLHDAMEIDLGADGHELRLEEPRALLRRVECLEGEVPVAVEFAPRPEYGLVLPRLDGEWGLVARGGPDVLTLSSTQPLTIEGPSARGAFVLGSGERASFALMRSPIWAALPGPLDEGSIEALFGRTIAAWRSWASDHQAYEGPWKGLVDHSGRVLQALTFAPTGAVIAAATTSLPEEVGGVRNWDYRFTWMRDASLTMQALWVAACPTEAYRFFEFLANASLSTGQGGRRQIMYGVGGENDLTERELPHLSGWRGSRPVRVGNGAWDQRQLDVFGELLGAAWILREQPRMFEPTNRAFLRESVDAAATRWMEADQGIWEMRGPPRHFLNSKLMCWVALDRGIALAGLLDAQDDVPSWEATREEIRAAILEQGWSQRAQAFTQSFGSDFLDASALRLPLVGFLPADDPRIRSTIEAIATRLVDHRGLVFRYLGPDGLPGGEGTFLLCTFWLAEALALAGELGRARETFERAVACANDLGLLSEEVDLETGELLGNFPQAFSHIGLINAAWTISQQATV
jgi:GH15 family glucan-1,4-alpha-glucosidase